MFLAMINKKSMLVLSVLAAPVPAGPAGQGKVPAYSRQ